MRINFEFSLLNLNRFLFWKSSEMSGIFSFIFSLTDMISLWVGPELISNYGCVFLRSIKQNCCLTILFFLMDPHPPLEVLLQGGTANVAILTEAHHVPFTSVDTLMCATFPDAGVLTPEFSVCRVGSPNKLACQPHQYSFLKTSRSPTSKTIILFPLTSIYLQQM